MDSQTGKVGCRVVALALCLPALAQGGEPPQQREEELDEALVEGARRERSPQKVIDWIARLVGKFTFEGHVDLQGREHSDDLRPVEGGGNCTGLGPAPAVQCELQVRWPPANRADGARIPGGVSHFDPAMMLYGFEPNRIGIRYMLVGSNGVSQSGLGLLVGDTLVSRTPCVDFPGNCQRVTRITAAPDLALVEMRIELSVDHRKVLEYAFVMRRVPGSASVVHPGSSDP